MLTVQIMILTVMASLFAVILLVYIQYFIAKEFYKVAQIKGYDDKKYLWIPFLLSFAGYLLVISLPVKNIDKSKDIDELPEI